MNIDLNETQSIVESAKEQIYLQGKTHIGKRAKPRRGQVFYCHLGVGIGSEFQKRRPCVVLSNTVNNINTSIIVVAPITHTQKNYPIFVPITDKHDTSGTVILSGYADLANIRAVSSYRLAGYICDLDKNELNDIDAAVARHLDLMHHYNTLMNTIEDKEKHVESLSGVLGKLKDITGAADNAALVEAVTRMVAENGKNNL